MKTIILKRILILIIPIFIFLGSYEAKADTIAFNCDELNPENGNVFIVFGLDKQTYMPGETIIGTAYGSSYSCGDEIFATTSISNVNPFSDDERGYSGHTGPLPLNNLPYYFNYSINLDTKFGGIYNYFFSVVSNTGQSGYVTIPFNIPTTAQCAKCANETYQVFHFNPIGNSWWTTHTSKCLSMPTSTTMGNCVPELPGAISPINTVILPNSDCGYANLPTICPTGNGNPNSNPIVNVR